MHGKVECTDGEEALPQGGPPWRLEGLDPGQERTEEELAVLLTDKLPNLPASFIMVTFPLSHHS